MSRMIVGHALANIPEGEYAITDAQGLHARAGEPLGLGDLVSYDYADGFVYRTRQKDRWGNTVELTP